MKPEAQFEHDLSNIAYYFGCYYVKIPDTRMINKQNRHRNREEKRPFDGILITPNRNFCIECKINSGKLLEHQKRNESIINEKNGSFYVLRKRIRKDSSRIQIEQPEKNVVFETENIEEIFTYFKEIK